MKYNSRKKIEKVRLAGGMGGSVRRPNAYEALERIVLACLLSENLFYESGSNIKDSIESLVPEVDPVFLSNLAIKARSEYGLRHVPLFLVVQMVRHDKHRPFVADLIPRVCLRLDETMEILAMYRGEGGTSIPSSFKRGIAEVLLSPSFNEYHFAKYKGVGKKFSLKDVICISHPNPRKMRDGWQERSNLFARALEGNLPAPETWEVLLSRGADKKKVFEYLLREGKLPNLAFLRNMRGMMEAGVNPQLLLESLATRKWRWETPLDFVRAAVAVPSLSTAIMRTMCLPSRGILLGGRTAIVIDVSGSMNTRMSRFSDISYGHAAKGVALLASASCETSDVWLTAGSDYRGAHETQALQYEHEGPHPLMDILNVPIPALGGGGIFTCQCLDYIGGSSRNYDRVIVITDSQDMDISSISPPRIARYQYIMNVAAYKFSLGTSNSFDLEVNGWSDKFLLAIKENEEINSKQGGGVF